MFQLISATPSPYPRKVSIALAEEGLPFELLNEITIHLHQGIFRLAWMDAPVNACVNGVASGGALSLAACADLLIAADTARFTCAYTHIGFTPDGSSIYFLSLIIGIRRAMELYMTNRTLQRVRHWNGAW